MKIDFLDLAKNKLNLVVDFSQIGLEDPTVHSAVQFYLNSLPSELSQIKRKEIIESIRDKKVYKFDFSPITQRLQQLTKQEEKMLQQLGIPPTLPSRTEAETRLTTIEAIRKQRVLKPEEVREKIALTDYLQKVLPGIESGVNWIEGVVENTHKQLNESLERELTDVTNRIIRLKREKQQLQQQLEKLPQIPTAENITVANRLQEINKTLPSLVSYRQNLQSYYDEVNNKRYWYKKFYEGVVDAIFRDMGLLPFFRSLYSAEEKADLLQIQNKLKRNEKLTEAEETKLKDYTTRHLRNEGFAYIVGYGVSQMPAWGAEIAGLGGVLSAAGVQPAIVRLITKDIGIKGQIPKKLLEFMTYGALQGATNVPLIAEGVMENMLDQRIVVPHGDRFVEILNRSGDNFITALSRAVGSSAVEHMSEFMGAFIQNWGRFFPKFVLSRWIEKRGFKNASQVMRAIKRGIRWNGIIGEVFEEELARLGYALLGETPYTVPIATAEGTKILAQEIATVGLGGFILGLPDMHTKLRQVVQDIKNYRQNFKPPIINEDDIQALTQARKKYSEPAPDLGITIPPTATEVLDVYRIPHKPKSITSPVPEKPEIPTVVEQVKSEPKDNLYKYVDSLETLEKVYKMDKDMIEQEINSAKQLYSDLVSSMVSNLSLYAKTFNIPKATLQEQVDNVVKELNAQLEESIEALQTYKKSYIKSYKTQKEILSEKLLPVPITIPKVGTLLPIKLETPQTQIQLVKELTDLANKTQKMLNETLPTLTTEQKIKSISSLYDYEIMNISFDMIKLKHEVQKELRPILQYDMGLVDSIAKYFDPMLFDMLKIAYLEDTKEYVLFDGHHRYLALSRLKERNELDKYFPNGIPATIVKFKNLRDLVAKTQFLRMINEARHGLNIVELAQAYQDLINQGKTIQDISLQYNKKRATVEETLKINKLSQKWKDLAVNKEMLPSKLQQLKVDALLLTMARLADKYNIPEVVQNDILNNWVVKEKLSPTALEDWLDTLFSTLKSSFTEKTEELTLFDQNTWQSLRSKFKDILKDIQLRYKKMRSLYRSYDKVARDLQEKQKQGQVVNTQTLGDLRKEMDSIEQEIKNLRVLLAETYKGRKLSDNEKRQIKTLEIKTANFDDIDKLAEHTLPLFPDEKANELGFKLIEDIRQTFPLLTLEEDELNQRIIIKEAIMSAPQKGYFYYLFLIPEQPYLFGVKSTSDLLTNLTQLCQVLDSRGVWSVDPTIKIVSLEFKNRSVYVDDHYVNSKTIPQQEKTKIEKILRQYFKSHIPIKFGFAEKPQQLSLFQKQFDNLETQNYVLFFPGGVIQPKKPIKFNSKEIAGLLNRLGISHITPAYEIALTIGVDKDNYIKTVFMFPTIQTKSSATLITLYVPSLKNVEKLYFLHRHPKLPLEVFRFAEMYAKHGLTALEKQVEMLRIQTMLQQEEARKFVENIKQISEYFVKNKIPVSDLSTRDFINILNNLPQDIRNVINELDKIYYSIRVSPQDIKTIESLLQLYPQMQLITYIFNDYVVEYNLLTEQKKIYPYEKLDISTEKMKTEFEYSPLIFDFIKRGIDIKLSNQSIRALLEYATSNVGLVVTVKNDRINQIFNLFNLMVSSSLNKELLLDYDYAISYIPFSIDDDIRKELEKFVNLYNRPFYVVSTEDKTHEVFFPVLHMATVGNKVYQNMIKKFGKYFSEDYMSKLFLQRFGYDLTNVTSEDGREFSVFLTRLMMTPDAEKKDLIDQWTRKELNFARISDKIKHYIRKTTREAMIKYIDIYSARKGDLVKAFLDEFGVDDHRQLDTRSLRRLAYFLLLAETDINIRKAVERSDFDEARNLTFVENIMMKFHDVLIADAVMLKLAKKYPAVEEFRNMVIRYLELRNRYIDRPTLSVDEIVKILGKDFVKNKFDTFVDYIETGKMHPNWTEDERKKVEEAYKVYKNMMDWIFLKSAQVGIKVRDPIDGTLSPIMYRENYFPHIYPPNFFKSEENLEQLVKEVSQKNNISQDDARMLVLSIREDMKSKHMGNLEIHRFYSVPGYEKSITALLKYINRAGERIAWVEMFGNDLFTIGFGYMPERLYDVLSKIPDRYTRVYIERIVRDVLQKRYHSYDTMHWFLRTLLKLQALKLPAAGIDNLWQAFVNLGPNLPIKDLVDATIKRLVAMGYEKEILQFYGFAEQLGRALTHHFGEERGDLLDFFVKMTLNLGFKQTEINNRVLAVFMGKEYVDMLRRKLKTNPQKVKEELERFAVRSDLIKKILDTKTITEDDEMSILFSLNVLTNHIVDFWFLPSAIGKYHLGRIMLHFTGTFYIPQTRAVYRLYIKPFFEYLRSGGKRGNVVGFAKFLLITTIAMSIARYIRDKIARREYVGNVGSGLINLLYFLLLSGWLGLFGLPLEVGTYGLDSIKDKFLGVGINYMIQLMDALITMNLPKLGNITSPGYKYLERWFTKHVQYYAPPNYQLSYNWLRSTERVVSECKRNLGVDNPFTRLYYTYVYTPAYNHFIKKYSATHIKMGRSLPNRVYLTPVLSEVVRRR